MESCSANIQVIKPRPVQRAETLVMGIESRTNHQRETNPITAEIPKLWQRFAAEQMLHYISEPIHAGTLYGVYLYGAYTDYSINHHREYSAIVAVEVSNIDNPAENMVGVALPAGTYLVFSAMGDLPHAVTQAWQQIWNYFTPGRLEQRAFTTDFEVYHQQQVDIYIALKPTEQSS